MTGWLLLALKYAPEGIRDAAWIARFIKWREEKKVKGELDSQKLEQVRKEAGK